MSRFYVVLIGIAIGLFVSFANSYSYAISGYTTSELSLIYIPLLTFLVFKLLKVPYEDQDILYASAIAIGIDITTTLTSGMYITYGFLSYTSTKLGFYGFNVDVPYQLFGKRKVFFIDVEALPTYIALATASLSGLFIAFALRNHFFYKERLKYPVAMASAMATQVLKNAIVKRREFTFLFLLGFSLQMLYFVNGFTMDLTPTLSMFIPGTAFSMTFIPLVFALFLLLPLGVLRALFIGSLLMYFVLTPIAIFLFRIPIIPAQSYEDMLFSLSHILLSYNVGFVLAFLVFYILKYFKQLLTSLRIATEFTIERLMLLVGVSYLILLGIAVLVIGISFGSLQTLFMLVLVLVLHFVLIVASLRVVGETGIASQALYPLVTLVMYGMGIRNVLTYALLDPYTGIPMPQTVAATSMNVFRYARFCKGNIIAVVKYLSAGLVIGSFVTYIYGNLLLAIYGVNSPQMPLTRWIPTVIWMSAIYSGKLTSVSLYIAAFSLVFAVPIALLSPTLGFSPFALLVGLTLTPDIGLQALLAFIVKKLVIKFGAAFHEKLILYATLFLLGAACAVIVNTVVNALGLSL